MSIKQSSTWPYLLVLVVALAAVAALVMNDSSVLQGASVHNGPAASFSPNCLDSDEKNDYYKFGTVHLGNVEYYDHCQDQNKVKQFYCSSSNSKKATKSYNCPNGCQGGVCQ